MTTVLDAYALIPVLGAILFATYGYWLQKTDKKLNSNSERLAAIEAVLPKMDKQLDRIEEKLNG